MQQQPKQQMICLASQYDQAAGGAFRARDDEAAATFRIAADKCRKLAEQLPDLPLAKRG